MSNRERLPSTRRRGGAALVALLCLSLLGLIIAAMLRANLTRRDHLRSIAHRLQADWLVEAGAERAAARLESGGDYEGETWRIPAEALGGRSAVVDIEVASADDGSKTVRVRADYPVDSPSEARARRSKTYRVRPGAETSGETP